MWKVVTKSRFGVFLLVVVIVGVVSFFVGQLFRRTTSLERLAEGHDEILTRLSSAALGFSKTTSALEQTVKGHDRIIRELSGTTVALGKVVEGHYETIRRATTEMQKDMKAIRVDTLEQISGIRDEIAKFRSDINKLIMEMSSWDPSEPNE